MRSKYINQENYRWFKEVEIDYDKYIKEMLKVDLLAKI